LRYTAKKGEQEQGVSHIAKKRRNFKFEDKKRISKRKKKLVKVQTGPNLRHHSTF
jgi:hypothetical protein